MILGLGTSCRAAGRHGSDCETPRARHVLPRRAVRTDSYPRVRRPADSVFHVGRHGFKARTPLGRFLPVRANSGRSRILSPRAGRLFIFKGAVT